MAKKQIKDVELSVHSLSDIMGVFGEETSSFLRHFKCGKNTSIENYIHSKALLHEQEGSSRTFVVLDDNGENGEHIVGYFTLTTKVFHFTDASGKKRKKLTGNTNALVFNTMLIAKIGRSDEYKGIIEGKEILNIALDYCLKVKLICAIKVVCVEYEDIPALITFYEEQNGFTLLQTNDNGLYCSFVKI